MTYEVVLPNGDSAGADSIDALALAVETLIDDVSRHLRQNLVVHRDGSVDGPATQMLQQAGMLV